MSKDLIEEMYLSKEIDYFSLERDIFIKAIQEHGLNILDVGCGTGALLDYFKKNQKCSVYGIEINENAFIIAKNNLDNIIKGNIETIDLPFELDFFDVVIMGDVLEHLVNPVGTIDKLLTVLKAGGKIHITVPNIRYWKVLKDLIFRDIWQYESWGILDFTHLRFFTKTSIVSLLKKNKITVINAEWVIQNPSKSRFLNKLTFRLFSGFLASHTFLTIQK